MSNRALHSVTFESQQMGSLKRLNVETAPPSASLTPRMAPRASEASGLLIMIRNKAARLGTKKRSEAKPSGTVFRTPYGG